MQEKSKFFIYLTVLNHVKLIIHPVHSLLYGPIVSFRGERDFEFFLISHYLGIINNDEYLRSSKSQDALSKTITQLLLTEVIGIRFSVTKNLMAYLSNIIFKKRG